MKLFQGIKFKVIFAIAVILTICFSGLTAYIINDQKVKLMGALKERGSDVANLVAKNAVQPIKDFDDAILQEAIIRVEQKNEIAYSQVFNTDNEPTIEEGMMLDGKETIKKKKPEVLPDNILVIKSKIIDVDADESLGTVEIGFFLDAVNKEIEKQIHIFVFGLVGLLTIVILIMYFYLSISIISPVVLLAKAAENLEDESVPIDTERMDDLGSLGRKFVEMRDAVRKRVDDLKNMNAKIEKQVKERTAELNQERNNIANLLNNMRQAVFTVSNEGKIMGPVSSFSQDIFGNDIIGSSIYETIYNGIDDKSELYASIKSVMTCVYSADDLQWDIMKDYLPTRLTYLPKNENDEEKIIKTAYNPLWDENEMLEKIMFVAEDITEIEKLEKEMVQQKEAASRSIQMLQELAAVKQDDLKDFFTSANHMIQECTSITKQIRLDLKKTKEPEGFDVLFRHLHTIKGNSRVFGLSLISNVVHGVESKVTEFINKNLKTDTENITSFIQDLYLVQGQINEYTKVAKEVFNFNFSGSIDHNLILFNLMKEFELRISFLVNSHSEINKARVKEANKKLQSWVKENPKRVDHLKDLSRISHSLKGMSRGMDEKELSSEVHNLESAFEFISSNEEINKEEWDAKFIDPLEKIKDLTRNCLIKSKILKEFSEKPELWTKLLTNLYNLSYLNLHQKNQNKDKARNYAYQSKSLANENGLEYIALIMDRILYLIENDSESEDILLCLKETWS
ncbi:MAG: Hpt domain-containing protein, partial [Bdellovibrionota bacterium]|nr:Hpt domain-containing protein [Bdellovibrionota bacterium]